MGRHNSVVQAKGRSSCLFSFFGRAQGHETRTKEKRRKSENRLHKMAICKSVVTVLAVVSILLVICHPSQGFLHSLPSRHRHGKRGEDQIDHAAAAKVCYPLNNVCKEFD